MSQKKVLIVGGIILSVLLVLMISTMDGADEAYIGQVNKERSRMQQAWSSMRNDKSPIPTAERRGLKLSYYAPDPDYKTTARLKPAPEVKLPKVAGWLHFELKDETYKLLAFWEPESGPKAIFVAFYDPTNKSTTYQAGRYLNLALAKDKTVPLDFNRAYNPYCVYDPERYTTCPLPPAPNKMPIAIEAGEKRYVKSN